MKIRIMHEIDLSEVINIQADEFSKWSYQQFQDCLQAQHYCVVLEEDHRIIGFAVLLLIGAESEILNIAVKKEMRGQGYGKLLLEHLLQISKKQGVKDIFLEVRISNFRARKLYEEHGFTQTGLRKDYYPAKKGREDAIILRRGIL